MLHRLRVVGSGRFVLTLAGAVAAVLLTTRPVLPPAAGAAVADPALPQDGDLTLGGNAGDVLVGLTLRPATAGLNEALVYVLPVEGEAAASAVSAELRVRGRSLPLRSCSATCRRTLVDLQGGERLEVRVAAPSGGAGGSSGGTAVFDLPALPAPDGSALVERAQARMHTLSAYRVEEWLGPTDVPRLRQVYTAYAFQAPDRMFLAVDSGFQRVWVGDTRYIRGSPDAAWRLEQVGPRIAVPRFDWDPVGADVIAPHLVGTADVEGVETQIVSFFVAFLQNPTWFRLWVDADGLVRQAHMRTQAAHYMDHRYYDFDAPFSIKPPTLAPTP